MLMIDDLYQYNFIVLFCCFAFSNWSFAERIVTGATAIVCPGSLLLNWVQVALCGTMSSSKLARGC